ncbi:MAG: cupin [Betaproteobacteria bacterium]|nr:cupin [Betaproteobacteria bacterium]
MKHPIINLDQLEPQAMPPAFAATGAAAGRYDPRMAMIGAQIGASKLGCNLTVLAPGMRAFPFHSHRVNEEMFIVVEGKGEVRIGAAVYPIRQGDIIACPPGGHETAHQIINNSDAQLRYLAISTQLSPEVAEFPDSGKFAVLLGESDGAMPFRTVGRIGETVNYWEGE